MVNSGQEWKAKEDFKQIDFSELPVEFSSQMKGKPVVRAFVNSQGIYRVEVEDEKIEHLGVEGTMSYLIDFNPNATNKFCMHA